MSVQEGEMRYTIGGIGVAMMTVLLLIAYQVAAGEDGAVEAEPVRVHRSNGFICFYTSSHLECAPEYVSIPPWQAGPMN